MVMPSPSQLVAINLKFGAHARPFKSLAFADLAQNALFLLAAAATTEEVIAEIGRLLARPVDDKSIVDALRDLRKQNKVNNAHGRWALTTSGREEMQREHDAGEALLSGVLARHFPGAISADVLREWFLQAAAEFFGFNAAELLKSISKNSSLAPDKPQSVRELLHKATATYNLEAHEDVLVEAFIAFLSSEDVDDRRYVTQLGFALLSALLVSADLGADPITVDEIRGATFVLDTNALFAIQLDTHRLAKSMKALALALKEIDAELVYLNGTKQEYMRVHAGRKGEIMALFRQYPNSVVIDAEDDFIESAIARGCEETDDFERFFDQIRTLPTELPDGPAVQEKDDDELEAEAKRAERDNSLKGMIQRNCMKIRARWDRRPKTDTALKHDAVLIRSVELLQKRKSKTWALSLDRGLRAAAAERAGAHAIPSVFMLDGLIQILAVHTGGPRHNAADFAPLLSSIMLNRCNPSERTYSAHDLRLLHSLHERVVDFSPDEIKKLTSIVTRHRLAGAGADDKEMQLAVQRAYQEIKQDYGEREGKALERAQSAERQLEDANKKIAHYRRDDCKRTARQVFLRALFWRVPASLVFGAIVFAAAWVALPKTPSAILDWASALLGCLLFLGGLAFKPVMAYFAQVKVCVDTH